MVVVDSWLVDSSPEEDGTVRPDSVEIVKGICEGKSEDRRLDMMMSTRVLGHDRVYTVVYSKSRRGPQGLGDGRVVANVRYRRECWYALYG